MGSEWTTWRPPCLSCTRTLSSPTTLAQTGPCPTGSQNARLGKGAPSPQSGPPTHGRCSRNGTPLRGRCPARGPRVNPKGRLNPADSERPLPPDHPGSQSDAAAARRIGAGGGRREYRECAGDPRDCSHTWTPRRGNHLSRHHSTRLRLDAQGLSTRIGDYHPTSRPLPVNAHRHDPRPRRRVSYPTAAAPRGHPGAGGTLLVPTLIPRPPLSG